jgi:hypothetical protein
MNAVFAAATQAEAAGIVMQVELKDGSELRGIPAIAVETTPGVAPYSQRIMVGDTEFLLQEVLWFGMDLP